MVDSSLAWGVTCQVVVMAALAIFPLTPAGLSSRAYRFALLGSVIACGHSLYQQHQRPRAWNMQGLQAWMQSIVPSPDFLSFLFSTIFFSSFVPVRFAVIPVLCRSLEQVANFLRRNFSSTQLFKKYLEQPCVMLLNNMTAVRTMSTNAEIFIGFLLIFLFLTSVSFSFLFMFLLLLLHWVHAENGEENTHCSMDLNAPLICDA
jgi:hypothetical protein